MDRPTRCGTTSHEVALRRICSERGIEIRRVGGVFHLVGHGVDIKALDLRQVAIAELQPVPTDRAGPALGAMHLGRREGVHS